MKLDAAGHRFQGARLLVLGTQPPADAVGATWFPRLLQGDQAGKSGYCTLHDWIPEERDDGDGGG